MNKELKDKVIKDAFTGKPFPSLCVNHDIEKDEDYYDIHCSDGPAKFKPLEFGQDES